MMKKIKTLTLFLATLLATNICAQTVTLDPTFGENGMTVIPVEGAIIRIKFDPAGNIFVLGSDPHNGNLFIVKTNANGTIDSSFGINGIAPLGIINALTSDFKITNENKILFVGSVLYATTRIIQLNEDGSFDTSFGNNGEIVFHLHDGDNSVNIENDDFILLGGDNTIAKYNYNGEFDPGFGIGGKVTLEDIGLPDYSPATCIKISNDQSIFVAGYSHLDNMKSLLWLLKMNPNGNLVTNFANNGIWEKEFTGYKVYFDNFIEDQNGNLLLTGSNTKAFMCSFFPNGIINDNFGTDGFSYFDELLPQTNSLKGFLQYGNKYLIGDHDKLICVNNDGSLDNSFNNTGLFTCDNYTFYDMKLQGIDKLILGGRNSNGNFLLTRLNIPPAVSVKEQDNSFATQVI
ncbi:MAG: hypothetical protein FWD09_06385, partial [Lentimicrobiaceae bacterium]|nr:hypothetical protein [Lentimicrobiaceae bacterium]